MSGVAASASTKSQLRVFNFIMMFSLICFVFVRLCFFMDWQPSPHLRALEIPKSLLSVHVHLILNVPWPPSEGLLP